MQVDWTAWNSGHITKHGGSVALAEHLIRENGHTMIKISEIHGKIVGNVDGRSWTLILVREPADADETVIAYPVTMYPTSRGTRRRRTI